MATLALVEDPSSALSDPELLIFRLWLQGHSFGRAAELLCALELKRGEEVEGDAVSGLFAEIDDENAQPSGESKDGGAASAPGKGRLDRLLLVFYGLAPPLRAFQARGPK